MKNDYLTKEDRIKRRLTKEQRSLDNAMEKKSNFRMLAKDCYVNNDTHKTMLNNNDLIVGSSGRGKTTGYVSPLISNMCDHLLFLGTTDVDTAKYIGDKMNIPFYNVLNMPLEDAYLFETGSAKGGIKVTKYRPLYFENANIKNDVGIGA